MKQRQKPTDRQLRRRLNECVKVKGWSAPPADNWRYAIKRLRGGKVCVVVNRENEDHNEIHCVFVGANEDGLTLEDL